MSGACFTVRAGPRAAFEGRRRLDSLLGERPPAVRDDARLCLTEFVTNAVEHAGLSDGEEIAVEVATGDRVRIDVTYPGPGFVPPPRRPVEGTERGRGLLLVEAIAADWGASSDAGHVWVELEARHPRSPPAGHERPIAA